MTKKLLPLFIIFALFLAACGSAGEKTAITDESKPEEKKVKTESAFTVTIDGEEQKFEPTSKWATRMEKSFIFPVDGKNVTEKAPYTKIFLANYELKSKDGEFFFKGEKVTKPEQVKIIFSFNGEKGTDMESPIKVGKYEIKPGDAFKVGESFGKFESADIFYFTDGKEKEASVIDNKLEGTLEITEVKDNTIKGKIDVTDGKHSIKGSFTAKGDNTVK